MAAAAAKEKALAALLDSNTITEAAEKAGVTRATIYRYMREDTDFAREYKAAQDQLALEQMDNLSRRRAQATEYIAVVMQDEEQPTAIRLKAAQMLITAADGQRKAAETIVAGNANKSGLERYVENLF